MSTEEILEKVAAEVSTCTKCDLCKSRTKAVPGEGNQHARIMFKVSMKIRRDVLSLDLPDNFW